MFAPAAPAGGGALAGIDPRSRILAVLAFALVTVACTGLAAKTAALGLAFLLLIASRQPIRPTLRRMAMMDGFLVFVLILLPFTTPGAPIFSLWGLSASWAGLWHALAIVLTANAVILALLSLLGGTDAARLGHALHRLGMPAGLVHLMLFTTRYVEVLRGEYRRMRTAMKVRGFRPRNSWHTYRSFGYLIGMVLIRAIERSERVLDAMRCRGFDGRIPLHAHLTFGPADAVFAALVCLALSAIAGIDLLVGAEPLRV